jgi:MFS family permease
VFGMIGGALADRWDARPVAIIGAVGVTAGVALLIPLADGWGPADIAWRLAIAGAGAGLFAGQNQNMAMARAPRHLMATIGATTSLVRQLGIALGPALATVVWTVAGDSAGAMSMALAMAAAFAAVSVVALVRRSSSSETQPAELSSDRVGNGLRRHDVLKSGGRRRGIGATRIWHLKNDEHVPAAGAYRTRNSENSQQLLS